VAVVAGNERIGREDCTMNADRTDENVGWPSYVDFLSTFIFLLILFIGSLVFQVSGVIAKGRMRRELVRISNGIGVPNYVRQNKIFIPLAEQVNFASGSSELDSIALEHLTNVGLQIAKACHDPKIRCNKIIVEGHADSVPVKSNPKFGNWKLSSVRALNVLQFFYGCGNCGYGEEIRSRLTLSGEGDIGAKQSRSGNSGDRRVDVVLDYGQAHDE
jgi:flagellar motor protein MotB